MQTFIPLNSLDAAGGQSRARKTAEGYRNRGHYVDTKKSGHHVGTKNKVGLWGGVVATRPTPDMPGPAASQLARTPRRAQSCPRIKEIYADISDGSASLSTLWWVVILPPKSPNIRASSCAP